MASRTELGVTRSSTSGSGAPLAAIIGDPSCSTYLTIFNLHIGRSDVWPRDTRPSAVGADGAFSASTMKVESASLAVVGDRRLRLLGFFPTALDCVENNLCHHVDGLRRLDDEVGRCS